MLERVDVGQFSVMLGLGTTVVATLGALYAFARKYDDKFRDYDWHLFGDEKRKTWTGLTAWRTGVETDQGVIKAQVEKLEAELRSNARRIEALERAAQEDDDDTGPRLTPLRNPKAEEVHAYLVSVGQEVVRDSRAAIGQVRPVAASAPIPREEPLTERPPPPGARRARAR